MIGHETGCLICGRPLKYLESQTQMECCVCHRTFQSNTLCEDGHFVCDECHRGDQSSTVAICVSSSSKDPSVILNDLMRMPGVHMHGPEHHILVGSALLSAYRNAGNDVDLLKALSIMFERGRQVPGGACGLWGCCGAAVSCGMAYSIVTGSTPLSGESWGRCNEMTSRCLSAIGSHGGPRCCKRDGYSAITAAARFMNETLDAGIVVPTGIECGFSGSNQQCIGDRCPFHVSTGRGRPRSCPSRWAWCRPRRPPPWSWPVSLLRRPGLRG